MGSAVINIQNFPEGLLEHITEEYQARNDERVLVASTLVSHLLASYYTADLISKIIPEWKNHMDGLRFQIEYHLCHLTSDYDLFS